MLFHSRDYQHSDTPKVPSNLLLNKIGKPAIYLPTVMIIWGTISAATAAVHSYGQLVAVRFCLGFIEAAYFVSYICVAPNGTSHLSLFLARLPVLSFVLVYA